MFLADIYSFAFQTSTHPQSIEWDDNTHLSGSDRALLDHYRKFTYKTLSCSPKTDNAFRVTVIKLASKFPFLHHGILACSALHLASSDPSNKEYYTIQSLQYQDQATPAFRWATMHVDSNNCQAVLAFAFFLVVCSLGSGFDDQGLFLSNDNEQDQVTDTDMPSLHWINILRNGCSMLCPVWDELTSGPLAPFAALWRDDIGVIVDSNDLLLRTLLSVFPEDGTTEYHIYHDSAVKLVAAFKFLQEHGPSPNIWDTLNSWPMRILPGYLDLLKQNRPSALLLLAYYAVLLRPLQGEWFLEGRITKLIDEIARRLEGRCSVRIWELFSEVRREYFS